jgi:hypothetical protein
MEHCFLHVGLQVLDRDIENFYKKIMGARIEREFVLSEEWPERIFHKKQAVKVCQMLCRDVFLELFIDNSPMEQTYAHVCLQFSNTREIAENAQTSGYTTLVKESAGNKHTYFVRDGASKIPGAG